MVCVNIKMKYSGLPLKRTPVELLLDESGQRIGPAATHRSGKVCFEMSSGSGKVIVAGVERYQGHLDGLFDIELRNLTEIVSRKNSRDAKRLLCYSSME